MNLSIEKLHFCFVQISFFFFFFSLSLSLVFEMTSLNIWELTFILSLILFLSVSLVFETRNLNIWELAFILSLSFSLSLSLSLSRPQGENVTRSVYWRERERERRYIALILLGDSLNFPKVSGEWIELFDCSFFFFFFFCSFFFYVFPCADKHKKLERFKSYEHICKGGNVVKTVCLAVNKANPDHPLGKTTEFPKHVYISKKTKDLNKMLHALPITWESLMEELF